MLKVVVCVSGGGTNLQAIIDGIQKQTITNTQIIGVISNNQNAFGLKRAEENNIPNCCISPKSFENRTLFHKALLHKINEWNPDLIVLAGFLVTIPEQMIQQYRNRIINVHPSLIPAFCGTSFYGLKVHEGALQRGVRITGATVHFVDEGTDTGPIILQKAVEVLQNDTAKELQKRVMEQAEWVILPQAITLIANGNVTVNDGFVTVTL